MLKKLQHYNGRERAMFSWNSDVPRCMVHSSIKKDTFKSEFLRTKEKDQNGRGNTGSLKLAFILSIFYSSFTTQCNAFFVPLFSPSFRFAVSLIALHISAAHYQHNAHSFNKQHRSLLMALGRIISEISFEGFTHIGSRAIFTCKC